MLKLLNYGQNDGNFGPDVNLVGDPGVDNYTLLSAGYLGGKVVALKASAVTSRGNVLILCDSELGHIPFGFLLNGPGENSGAIGPSGSGKMGVVRALPAVLVDSQAFIANPNTPYAVGQPLYVSSGATAGMVTSDAPAAGAGVHAQSIGTITNVPSASFPWLGIASLL